ncbi:MAG: SAM-dependent methyltransferase [Actinomycetota bacterium]|nr:SAM-dependent methyltransferase [Actinomycetota bacterium]
MIAERGPLSFRDFMELALYHPEHGYYSSGAVRTGRAGHFLTSAELDPAFGELWARALEQVWELCGLPDPFTVVEIGGGEAGFAAAILESATMPLSYRLVERVEEVEQRQRQRLSNFSRVSWSRTLDDISSGSAHFVIAVEVLDNLPVHVIERVRGVLREIHVDGDLNEVPGSLSTGVLESYGRHLGDGERCEVGLDAIRMAKQIALLIERGVVSLIDYGYEGSGRQTLVSYSGAGPSSDLLAAPGERDITAHVNWDTIGSALRRGKLEVAGPVRQAKVLRALGAAEIDRRLQDSHTIALAERKGAEAVRALSRRHALRALLDEGGLGGLQVMAGYRGIARPPWL